MRCPDDMELTLWSEGHLPPDRAEAIGFHLQECLACRVAAGEPADELLSQALDGEGPVESPPFEEIDGRLRASYMGWSEPDTSFLDAALTDELPILMAADTENHAGITSVPSYYCEDGRLVVTFRVDDESRVTAFFVSEDAEQARFRALRVGERFFLGDAEGRVVLSGVKAEEMLGSEISVPPVLASTTWTCADLVSAGETIMELLPWGPQAPDGPCHLRVAADAEGLGLLLRLDGNTPGETFIVVISDNRSAQLLALARNDAARCPLGAPAPVLVQFHLLGRS